MANYNIGALGVNFSQFFKVDSSGTDFGYGVKLIPYDGNPAHKNVTLSGYKYQGTDLTNLCSAYYTGGTSTTYTTNFTNISVPNGNTITYNIQSGGGGGGSGGRGISSNASGAGGSGGNIGSIVTGTYTNNTGSAILMSLTIGSGGLGGINNPPSNGQVGGNTVLTINGTNYTAIGGSAGIAGGSGYF